MSSITKCADEPGDCEKQHSDRRENSRSARTHRPSLCWLGQLVPPEGAADQKRQDDVVASLSGLFCLTLQSRAARGRGFLLVKEYFYRLRNSPFLQVREYFGSPSSIFLQVK